MNMRLILVVVTFLFLTAEAPSPWGIDELIGKKAPDFVLKDMNGATISLSSLTGKVVLINFWATWCPPCRDEMPALNKLYNGYKNRGLVVLAVSTDRRESDVKKYLSRNSFDFPVLTDLDMKVSRQYKVFSMPTSFLLDKNGVIIKKYLGEEEWDSPEIRKEVMSALGIRSSQ
jgi:peroxiredoxin